MLSIITATYNSEKSISSSIESVISQTEKNIEFILVDGASTDNTVEIARRLLEKGNLKKFIIISEPDKGIYDALNKGIAAASGDIIGFVHSDDLLADNTIIEKVVSTINKENIDGIYGHLQYVQQDDPSKIIRYWKSKEFKPRYLKYGWMPPHPTLFLKKEVYVQSGNFDTSFKIAADYDFILRVFKNPAYSIKRLDNVLVKMRMGGASNKNLGNIIVKMKEDLRALKNNQISFKINALLFKNLRKVNQFF